MGRGVLDVLGVWLGWFGRDVASPHAGVVHVVARGTAGPTGLAAQAADASRAS
jgi:hypothetical protein